VKLTVIGCGYLGATHAACMAELGHQVLGMDSDVDKVHALNSARAPFFEQGLDDLLAKHTATGRLRFTASYAEAADFGDTHFLAVGTPQLHGEQACDLSHLFNAVSQLAPCLNRPALIVGKSTVPVGTAARITDLLHATAPAGQAVRVAWNPEFLRESFAIRDTLNPDRIVVGLHPSGGADETLLRTIYAALLDRGTPFIVTDLVTSELVKTAANAFLATKISFINAMAEVCEAAGANVHQLAFALSHDVRIGPAGMQPGLGFGGGCLPKDIRGFMVRAGELGAGQALSFLREVDAINTRRRSRMVDLAREQCGGTLKGKRIAVWGAAFKPNTDDVRDSPALAVAQTLHQMGANVTVYDPMALDNARKLYPQLDYANDATAAVEGAALLLHLTEWPEFSQLDPHHLSGRVASPQVIDGRGTLDPVHWREAGWSYRSLGHS